MNQALYSPSTLNLSVYYWRHTTQSQWYLYKELSNLQVFICLNFVSSRDTKALERFMEGPDGNCAKSERCREENSLGQ